MTTTAHLGITLLEAAQAQKEITVNEGFARIDALLNAGVVDKDLSTPPVSPVAGDVYIVASGATGAWSGKEASVAYFDQIWRFVVPNEGLMLWVMDENKHYVFNGTGWSAFVASGGGSGDMDSATYDSAGISQQLVGVSASQTLTNKTLQAPVFSVSVAGVAPVVAEGRLSLVSGLGVSVADVTSASTLYYTPHSGTHISLYDTVAAVWRLFPFSQISLSVPATTHTNYDVFVYVSSGAVVAEMVAWTNDTTRASALALQDGVYVKAGALGRRYVGSFRTTAVSGRVDDSQEKRFVWNYYNRVSRALMRAETAVSWSYSTGSNRQANGNAASQVAIMVGVREDTVPLSLYANVTNSTATARAVSCGIGVNSAASFAAIIGSAQNAYPVSGQYPVIISTISSLPPSEGMTYYTWIERGAGADAQTWYGNGYYGLMGHCYG